MRFKSTVPIFLLGCPRSGTTLLQSLLSAHPQIASFTESKFFQCLPPAEQSKRRKLGMISSQLKPWLETYFRDYLKRPELLQYLPQLPFRTLYAQRFFEILSRLASEQGKSIVLEKTPQHIFFLEHIITHFSQSKIIHLIRKGEDVVASLYEATHKYPQYWDGVWEVDKCIDWWNRAVYTSKKYANHPNHLLVSYEELLESTDTILKNICDFLELSYHPEMIQNYASASQSLILDAAGRSVNCSQIQSSNSNKFHQMFTEEQQQYVLSNLKKAEINSILT
ncbi:MAG: sulfotransferase [Microcoleaceae cyanobacterium]